VLALIAAEGGIAVSLGVTAQPLTDFVNPEFAITAISRVAAMAGTFLALVSLILASRLSWLERDLGHDRLVSWHRKIGPISLYLILAHVLLVTIGYAAMDGISVWQEFWRLVLEPGWMLPALAGFVFMMMVGVTSYRRARNRMSYETWWTIHLYAYLGVSLSFMHQIETGAMFIGNDALTYWWTGLYVLVFAVIIGSRWLLPLMRSLRHRVRVSRIEQETPSTWSVYFSGRNLDRLGAVGGQFFEWRFLNSTSWWQAHPFSLSDSPTDTELRITVRKLGDFSNTIDSLKPGTRVMIEGPYGVFTQSSSELSHVVLIAGGVGITPIAALMKELPETKVIDLIWRSSTETDLPLRAEIEDLARGRNITIHYLIGSRSENPLNALSMLRLIPHLPISDIYMCGPEGMVSEVKRSLEEMGVRRDRIHDEAFAF
jgi:predicted ferric reductase